MSTPRTLYNRPGLSSLQYRVGQYGDFFNSMLARASGHHGTAAAFAGLTTRSLDDPAIALMDAFACVCDILTFYQERIADEGYLRTATERASLLGLANLTGYRASPGVDASVYLAYTLEVGGAVTIPAGSRVQSVPGPGATAQMFETSDDVDARAEWNAMRPRLLRPTQPDVTLAAVFLQGTDVIPKPGDPLLLVADGVPVLRRVAASVPQFDKQRVEVTLAPKDPPVLPLVVAAPILRMVAAPAPVAERRVTVSGWISPAATQAVASPPPLSAGAYVASQAEAYRTAAIQPPAHFPASPQLLMRSPALLFEPQTETALALKTTISPVQQRAVYRALGQLTVTDSRSLELHAFRANTAPFGSRAPLQVDTSAAPKVTVSEWTLNLPAVSTLTIKVEQPSGAPAGVAMQLVSPTGLPVQASSAARMVVSTVTVNGTTVRLSVERQADATASLALSNALGSVDVQVTAVTTNPALLTLTYGFQKLALTLTVSGIGSALPTVSGQGLGAAPLVLKVAPEANTNNADVLLTATPSAPGAGNPAQGPGEVPRELCLDGVFTTITPQSWVAFAGPDGAPFKIPGPMHAVSAATVTRVAYGQVARATLLGLDADWIDPATETFVKIRNLAVYCDSTALTLAPEDVTDPVGAVTLELDGLYPGLAAGRTVMVSGERTDLPGVTATELVMIAGAEHTLETAGTVPLAGETVHTVLTFSSPLSYTYKRDTVTVCGNVVRATQGETQTEVLGSGNGTTNQSFVLKKPPLTYLSAATASGTLTTLRVMVNGVAWTELPQLTGAGPDDRVYVVQIGDDDSVTVRFGDGIHGARLPSGAENVRAQYRSGLGLAGNLDTGTLTTLMSRPLGVKAVGNPLPASGGADREGEDSIRGHVPLGLTALDRLVSVADYQDFCSSFAGIGKAQSQLFSGAEGPLVHVTLAGSADAPLDATSTLWAALAQSLRNFGDPSQPFTLAVRSLRLVLAVARIGVDPAYQWVELEPRVRAAVMAQFGFDQRALGQTLYVSELVTAMQQVAGVSTVDLRCLVGIPSPFDGDVLQARAQSGVVMDVEALPAQVQLVSGRRRIVPAELAVFSDRVADMLLLSESVR